MQYFSSKNRYLPMFSSRNVNYIHVLKYNSSSSWFSRFPQSYLFLIVTLLMEYSSVKSTSISFDMFFSIKLKMQCMAQRPSRWTVLMSAGLFTSLRTRGQLLLDNKVIKYSLSKMIEQTPLKVIYQSIEYGIFIPFLETV